MNHILPSIKKTIVLSGVVFFVAACSQKTAPAAKVEEPYDGPKISYVSDIAPIMERSCAPCHYPAQDGNKEALDTYAAVKDELDEILYHVQLPSDHYKHMPYKNKKPDFTPEEIQMLKDWARSGFIES